MCLKKMVSPATRRPVVSWLRKKRHFSERRNLCLVEFASVDVSVRRLGCGPGSSTAQSDLALEQETSGVWLSHGFARSFAEAAGR